ncbi:hypothetical protein ASPZODRAFT_704722 [Penicilliopsis zonata CBS 506.65]|uniref:Uncharacterized protein n=1 Tax=Penicilliopsis zonata CBS 506.65 TaxID=1073090 RepID=A0A1L9SBX5_9EURO|nr:hypothetical protein ASPZODRAFT_704722 [Penicilliopsis zonata CBS 506.65]OJJ44628.1 hypothetical protein ASPZODRAFT_704722 [Penicilliopsis zonata CBS 506.65]
MIPRLFGKAGAQGKASRPPTSVPAAGAAPTEFGLSRASTADSVSSTNSIRRSGAIRRQTNPLAQRRQLPSPSWNELADPEDKTNEGISQDTAHARVRQWPFHADGNNNQGVAGLHTLPDTIRAKLANGVTLCELGVFLETVLYGRDALLDGYVTALIDNGVEYYWVAECFIAHLKAGYGIARLTEGLPELRRGNTLMTPRQGSTPGRPV